MINKLKNKVRKNLPFLVPVLGPVYAALRDWRLVFIPWQMQYSQRGLITDAACEFMKDPRFVRSREIAVKECKQQPPTGGDWRLYTFAWAAEHATKIEGDFAECGVNRGLTSRLIVEYLDFKKSPKKFYLVDMFELGGGYGNCYEETRDVFAPFQNVKVIKGHVPEALSRIDGKKFAYVHIDMNAPEPEMAAIDFFWDKMNRGGVVMLCDYNIFGRKPQRDAWNEWAKTRGVSILQLPTTQGLIIKP